MPDGVEVEIAQPLSIRDISGATNIAGTAYDSPTGSIAPLGVFTKGLVGVARVPSDAVDQFR